MILYSDTALGTLGGITSQQMETIIAEGLADSNQALINSEIPAYFNPVYIGPVRRIAFKHLPDQGNDLELYYTLPSHKVCTKNVY